MPLCCGMRSHPHLFILHPYFDVDACLSRMLCEIFLFLIISQTCSLASSGLCYRSLSSGNAACDLPNPSDSGRVPASFNAVSRERLVTLDAAADAFVTVGHGREPPCNVLYENVHGRTAHAVARRSPHPERVQHVSIVLDTRCSQMGL